MERATDPWPAISEQFVLRILAAAYQMSGYLEAVEADEQDPDRLEKLYRIDHANARVRRQAENLQVLTGRKVEDAGRQVTTLHDVIRASTSSIESYRRIQIGRIAGLAVVEFASDDVIRVLTELIDNAARFSPPATRVVVSAHLTERGSVLVRVEDTGMGIRPDRLAALNRMLASGTPATLSGGSVVQLGLAVVQRLAIAHHLRVRLTNRQPAGTTASILIPEELLCEIQGESFGTNRAATRTDAPQPSQPPQRPSVPAHAAVGRPVSGRPAQPAPRRPAALEGRHGVAPAVGDPSVRPASAPPVPPPGRPPGAEPVSRQPPNADSGHRKTSGGLPVRVPSSIRDQTGPAPSPATVPRPEPDRELWPDETAEFAAGFREGQRPLDPSSEGHQQ